MYFSLFGTREKSPKKAISAPEKSRRLRTRLRQILLLSIILLMAVFAVYYYRSVRISSHTIPAGNPGESANNQSISVVEPFRRHVNDLVTGAIIAEIYAQKAELFADGRNVLTSIENTRFINDDGNVFTLKASTGFLSKDMQNINVDGDVVLSMDLKDQDEPFYLYTQELRYEREKNMAHTDQKVKILGKDLRITGDSFIADLARGFLYVEKNMETHISNQGTGKKRDPVVITSEELQYNYNSSTAFYIGSPVLRSGTNSVKGDEMTFHLDPENRKLIVEGNVITLIHSRAGVNPFKNRDTVTDSTSKPAREPAADQETETRIESNRLIVSELTRDSRETIFYGDVQVFHGDDTLRTKMLTLFLTGEDGAVTGIIAEGNTWFRWGEYEGNAWKGIYYPEEEKLVLTREASVKWDNHVANADEILIPPGQQTIILKRNVLVTYQVASSHPERQPAKPGQWSFSTGKGPLLINADEATYYRDEKKIIFQKNVDARRGDLNVRCERLDVFGTVTGNDIDHVTATGNVVIVQGANHASANRAVFFIPSDTLELEGDCRIIQENDTIQANTISFDQKNEIYTANGNVRIIRERTEQKDSGSRKGLFSFSSSGDPLQVFAQSAVHDRKTRRTQYRGKVIVYDGDMTLKADNIETLLNPQENEIQNLHASGNVDIKQQNNIASGNELLYNKSSNKLILSGDPAMVKQQDRVDRGHRIIIYTDQKRIFIDSMDSDSSESIYYPEGRETNPQEGTRKDGSLPDSGKGKQGKKGGKR